MWSIAFNAVEVIAADVQNNPSNVKYISWDHTSEESPSLYFDADWKLNTEEESVASVTYKATTSTNSVGSKLYTLTLKDFKLNGQSESLLSDITIKGFSKN